MEWLDKPNQKRMSANVNGEKVALHVGNCAIGLFRHRPDMDYLAYKDEEDSTWTLCFDKHPLVYWMGGIALGEDAQRTQHLMERNNGLFYERFGWNADTVIEDYPSEWEVKTYLDYLASGSEDMHQDLLKAMEDEDD